ncbi:MAG: efflux RND transporter permease subunit, partial [Candidatus Acidiferrales bacterium]
SIPPPFGGKYRQIMVYVDPTKLQTYDLSPMDVVRAVNNSNLILPAGDVKIGPNDYKIYTNSQFPNVDNINSIPLKTVGESTVTVGDVGHAEDGHQIQTNVVRVDGQPSVYLPILKQGGDTNTIQVVDGIKAAVSKLVDIPKNLSTHVVFDQSLYVKAAIETLLHEGGIGLILTAFMVLIFLGSMRATIAVFLSIPLSALAAIIGLYFGGRSINSMILAGLALVFSRLIDNAVIVLENIFRHLDLGETPEVAAEKGGQEVSLAVLAATLTSAVVFFPVTFLYGVSRFLFSALALAVVLALAASYVVAMTVVPLFCAMYIKSPSHGAAEGETASGLEAGTHHAEKKSWGARFNESFGRGFHRLLDVYEHSVRRTLARPK